jgi:Ankyrin repeats (3 copies)
MTVFSYQSTSVTRYVPNTGADRIINRITNKTTVTQFQKMCVNFPKFQLWHSDKVRRHTVLHKATEVGNVDLIEYLVRQAPELLERGTKHDATPLGIALEQQNLACLKKLLELGANPNFILEATNTSALHRLIFLQLHLQDEGDAATIAQGAQIIKLFYKHGAERYPDRYALSEDEEETAVTKARVDSVIQQARQEVAAERREEQRLVNETLYDSQVLPPSDLCRLVSEFI